jgi:hypothetical protein
MAIPLTFEDGLLALFTKLLRQCEHFFILFAYPLTQFGKFLDTWLASPTINNELSNMRWEFVHYATWERGCGILACIIQRKGCFIEPV